MRQQPRTGQSPEATHHPPGHTSASHSISGLAQAHHPATLPPCRPHIPQHCPRYPGRVQARAGHRHTPRPSRMFEGLRWCMGPRCGALAGVPSPRSAGFSGHPVRAGSYRRSPQALPHQLWGATLVTGALRGTGSWRGTWAPDPTQPMALSSSPAFQTQNHSSQNVQNQARTRRNFMETFLWGLVKSVPTPTQSAARRLTHPVLTPLPAPPAWPLLLPKQFHFYCPCGSLEQTRPAGWLVPQLHAAPPLVPDMQVGDRASGQCDARLATSDQQQGPGTSSRPFPESLDGRGCGRRQWPVNRSGCQRP